MQSTTPDNRLRIAFAGAGRMAANHLSALRRIAAPHYVGAVFDGNQARAREFADRSGAQVFQSMGDLLRDYAPHIVHVCTPRGRHYDVARAAIEAGAHVYVEKPFVETSSEARALLDLARRKNVLVCAGHQLIADPAFVALRSRLPRLGPVTQVDSHFAFRPVGVNLRQAGRDVIAHQLADVLPHPLYALVALLECLGAKPEEIELASARASLTDVHAVLRWRDVFARLSVTLRGRPVASTLAVSGEGGALVADFVRSVLLGSANPGTEALEKIVNPLAEGWQLGWRTVRSLARRLRTNVDYPGLAELLEQFYGAVAQAGHSPVTDRHLIRVTEIYEDLVANVRALPPRGVPEDAPAEPPPEAKTVAVTGVRGFVGGRVAKHLAEAGYRVRGISRTPDHDQPYVHEWFATDLSDEVSPEAFAGVEAVVHAAAETAGGYEDHQRNTIGAARHVLRAMAHAGVTQLVHISTISVLQPALFRRLDERSPVLSDPRSMGPYAWGKTLSEVIVRFEAKSLGVQVRTVRPGTLVDLHGSSVPGMLGRRLFGRWHLGLGWPGLRIPVCPVDRCAAAIAWCVARFDSAPQVVNLLDRTIRNRGQLLHLMRANGWDGRMLWVPIWAISAAFHVVRFVMALARGTLPERRAVWSVLRPPRYDHAASDALLAVAADPAARRPDVAFVA